MRPTVSGGAGASLRRTVHYDFKDNALRRYILFNAKADIISYGMGDKSMPELADALRDGKEWKNIKGLWYISYQKQNPKTRRNSLLLKNAKPTKSDSLKLSPAFIKTNVRILRNFRRKKTC